MAWIDRNVANTAPPKNMDLSGDGRTRLRVQASRKHFSQTNPINKILRWDVLFFFSFVKKISLKGNSPCGQRTWRRVFERKKSMSLAVTGYSPPATCVFGLRKEPALGSEPARSAGKISLFFGAGAGKVTKRPGGRVGEFKEKRRLLGEVS